MIDLCTQKHSTPPGAGMATLTVQCAWCLTEQGRPLGNGSHGICTEHAARILAAHRARRKASRQQ